LSELKFTDPRAAHVFVHLVRQAPILYSKLKQDLLSRAAREADGGC